MNTPSGECEPFICSDIVKQSTALGPVLNNCSLEYSKESYPYYYGKTEIKSLKFVHDIADLNDKHHSAVLRNKIIQNVLDQKRPIFSSEKYEMLEIDPTKTDPQTSTAINGETVKSVCSTHYLGDHFNATGTGGGMFSSLLPKDQSTENPIRSTGSRRKLWFYTPSISVQSSDPNGSR